MLKTRVITALVILPIVLIALFLLPNYGWALFTLLIVSAAQWEWSRFCQLSSTGTQAYLAASLLLGSMIFISYNQGQFEGIPFKSLALAGFVVAAIFWILVVPVWLLKKWRPASGWLIALAGWAAIFPAWLALLFLHDVSPWLLLSFAAIVWVADIAAYFVGKRFGKNKLAPAISPGKTIEGVLGGMAGVTVYFFLWQLLIGNTFVGRQAWAIDLHTGLVALFGFFILLSVVSVMGDLFESWMKRGANLKDSSNLLPGHGGILDRIDALTSTLPLAGLYVLLQSGR